MTEAANNDALDLSEDNLIWAKESMKRIKAIANTLTTLERNGHTDELFEGTLHGLMGAIDSEADKALELLEY